jgi:hypothetical protein
MSLIGSKFFAFDNFILKLIKNFHLNKWSVGHLEWPSLGIVIKTGIKTGLTNIHAITKSIGPGKSIPIQQKNLHT